MSRLEIKDSGRRTIWIASGLCLALLVGLYVVMPYATGYGADRHPIAYWLWYFWRDPDWQHGVLVLPIIVGLLWRQRHDLFGGNVDRPAVAGAWWGLVIVSLALGAYFVGYRANIYYFGYFSAQLLTAGLIVWLLGWRWFSRLLFFWCFLAFLWPLYFLESRLGFPLRMLMTELSSGVLNVLSVEHLRQGTALLSPADAAAGVGAGEEFALEVANPCSGIRSLFSLTMVGALFGYLTLPRRWQWMAVCASAIPLAVAGNAVRILLLLAGSKLFGSEFAVGADGGTSVFHLFAGIAVFLVALGGMGALVRGLRWWEDRRQRRSQPQHAVSSEQDIAPSKVRAAFEAG